MEKTLIHTLFSSSLHTKQDMFIFNNNIINTTDITSYTQDKNLHFQNVLTFSFKVQSHGHNNDMECLNSILPFFPNLRKFENNTTTDIMSSLPEFYNKLSSLTLILCPRNFIYSNVKSFFQHLSKLKELKISIYIDRGEAYKMFFFDVIACLPKNLTILHIHRNQFISKQESELYILGISYLSQLIELEMSVTSLYNPQFQEIEFFSYFVGENLQYLKRLHIKRMYRDINDMSNLIETMFSSNRYFRSLQLFVIKPFLYVTDKTAISKKVLELRPHIRFTLET